MDVLAHYYLDRHYNPFSAFHRRIAVETEKLPDIGDLVIIKPEWQGMNDTHMGPGVYQVLRIMPDEKSPEPFYDYSPYMSWLQLVEMNAVIVKPILVIDKFKDVTITINDSITDDGVVVKNVVVINDKTGEIREVVVES